MKIESGTEVTISTGRRAAVLPRTMGTCTGWVVWLTDREAKNMRLSGHSTGRYSYSVDMAGKVERWINGYGGYIAKVAAPVIIGGAA